MWGVGQGQIVYSNYFKTYLYVHMGVFLSWIDVYSDE